MVVRGAVLDSAVVQWMSGTPECFKFRVETLKIGSKWESHSPGPIESALPESVLGRKLEIEFDEVNLKALASLIRPNDEILHISLLEVLPILPPQDQVYNLMKFSEIQLPYMLWYSY